MKSALEDLRMIHRNFKDGAYTGIDLSDFSLENKKLSDRFEAHSVPILLIIPEYRLLLNKTIKILNEWLQYDEDYIGLIQEDLKVLEKRKKNMQSVRHNQKQLYNQLNFRLKTIRAELESAQVLFKQTFQKMAKRQHWDVDFEEKNQVILNFQLESLRLKGIKESKYLLLDCNSMLDIAMSDLDKLETDLTRFKTNMNQIKPKRVL